MSPVYSAAAFVGRSDEYAWLEGRLQLAASGRPQWVLLEGDAGIGKTRLVREIEAAAARAGVRTWHGRAREDLSAPYLLFQPLLAEIAGGDAAGADPTSTAGALRSLLAETGAAAQAHAPDAHAERLRLFHAVATGSFALARERPALVVLEDLHWADAASLDLLAHLTFAAADHDAPLRLLVLCTLRPFEADEHLLGVLERIVREEHCQRLELRGFDEAEVEALIRASGVPAPSHQLVARIAEVTAGNPLFAEEILHLLRREDELVERGGRWTTRVDPAELALPDQVTRAIAARLLALSPRCREALAAAACLGDRFEADDLAGVTDAGDAELAAWLDEGLRAHVLTSVGDRLAFAHPLVRQALYTSGSPLQRRAIHRRIATALERSQADGGDVEVARIAHHWALGQRRGDEEIVLRRARLAGDRAFSVFASGEAARHYEAALAVDRRLPLLRDAERAALHRDAAQSHYRNMDAAACLEHLAQASEIFRRIGDATGLAGALLERARVSVSLAPVAYGTQIDVSELEALLAQLGDKQASLRGWILFTLTDVFMHARNSERAEECARRAMDLGRKLADDRLLAAATTVHATVKSQRLAVRDALAGYRESHRLATQAADPWIQGWSLQRLPLVLVWLGHLDEADALVEEASRSARRTGDWADHSLAVGTAALLALLRGDFPLVERRARETMAMVRRSGYPWGGVVALTALCAARALQAEWDAAEDALAILEEPGRVFAEVGLAAHSIAAVGRLRLRALSGRATPEDRDQVAALAKLMQSMGTDVGTIGPLSTCVEIADLLTDASLAGPSVASLDLAEARGVLFPGGGEHLLPRVQGLAAALEGRWDAALAYFARAVEFARAAGARPERARSELDCARMLLARDARGDREQAARLLAQALPALRELGMHAFLPRAEELALELGVAGPPARDEAEEPAASSRREREILEALARGRSHRDIADALLLGEATLRRRAEALLARIGAASRAEAAAWAFEQGLALPEGLRGEDAERRGLAFGARPEHRAMRASARAAQQIIFVSDLEQSTELIAGLGDRQAQRLIRVHNRIVRACLRGHGGAEIQHTGDGFIAAFGSACDAVHCAVAIQRRFERRNLAPGETRLRVRIGLHAGTPLAEEGRLFGIAMNTSARICSRAAPAEILASEAVRALCKGTAPAMRPIGALPLKGLEQPVPLHRVAWEEEDPVAYTGM